VESVASRRSAYLFKQRSIARGSPQWMQVIPRIPYTLFLRSPCAYACGDREYVSTRPGAAAAGVDGLRQCGRSRRIARGAMAEVRSFSDAPSVANRARVRANDRQYEVSLRRRCQDADNFWSQLYLATIERE